MTASELINFLQQVHPDTKIVVRGYEDGYNDIQKLRKIRIKNFPDIKRLNRKTICYSKNEEIHDNVIGMYIARHYYRKGVYGSGVINGLNP
jgi:IS1 family transposase